MQGDTHEEMKVCEAVLGEIINTLGIAAQELSDDQGALATQIIHRARVEALRGTRHAGINLVVDEADIKKHVDAALAGLADEYGLPGAGLRAGRPEHLTLEAAEQHADGLRALEDNVTVVGRLLIVAVDEVRRLRDVASELEDIRDSLRSERDEQRRVWNMSTDDVRAENERLRAENAEVSLTLDIQCELDAETDVEDKRLARARLNEKLTRQANVTLRAEKDALSILLAARHKSLESAAERIGKLEAENNFLSSGNGGLERRTLSAEAKVAELEAENTVLRAAREGARAGFQKHEEYLALAQELVRVIDEANTVDSEAFMRDLSNAASALRNFNWAIPVEVVQHAE